MNPPLHIAIVLVALLCAVLQSGQSFAGPSKEVIRDEINHVGIPHWKQQADAIVEIRKRARDPYYVKQLEELDVESATTVPKLLGKAPRESDAKELDAKMLWLRWKVLSQNADSRYAYMYAYNLSHTRTASTHESLLRTAASYYLLGKLSLQIDGARCEDNASPSVALAQFEREPAIRAIADYLAKMSGPKRAEALLHAISIEEMRGERSPQAWLCRLGAQSMLKALDAISTAKVVPSEGVPSGAVVQIDTSGVEPQFIDENQWRQMRKAILDRMVSDVTSEASTR